MASPADGNDTTRRSISSTPRLTPEEVRNRAFKGAMRGISEAEVRNFLHRTADELAAARDRERDLQTTISGLEDQIRNPAPVTEEQLIDSLGAETARVLRTAQSSAAEIVAKAEARADETLTESQTTAQRVRDEAARLAREQRDESDQYATRTREEADANVATLNDDAENAAQTIRNRATAVAETAVEEARERGREMVNEAKAVRERVLTDLARRRADLQAQLDELRSGRDRLVESYEVVRRTLVEAAQALEGTEATDAVDVDLSVLEPSEIDAEIDEFIASEPSLEPEVPSTPPDEAPEAAAAAPEGHAEIDAEAEATPDADAIPKGSGLRRYVKGALGYGPDGRPLSEEESAEPEESPRRDAGAVFAALREARVASTSDEEIEISEDTDEADAADEAPLTGDAALLAERDASVAPIEATLGRALKRVVQDDQNELLDTLRRFKRRRDPTKLLPDRESLVIRWSEPMRPALDEAYASAPGATGTLPDDLVASLTTTLVGPLHERLVDAFAETADREELAGRIGSRFREWRSGDLDVSIREVLATAYSQAVFDAAPENGPLRWVPARPGSCSDCDDNALEAVERAKPFPTGHQSPPAHAGCRCLLVVD